MNFGLNIYQMLSNKTNLYINGCSFVAGNSIEDNSVLSRVLSRELNLDFVDDSANGQSFSSTFTNTITKLSCFDNIQNYLVVIGLTWEPRYSIPFNKGLLNITPADIGNNPKKSKFDEKYSTWRRLTSPYYVTLNGKHSPEFNSMQQDIENSSEKVNEVLSHFRDYYEALVKHDSYIKTNQLIDNFTKILALQSFLDNKKIDYVFLDFKGYAKYPYVFEKNVKKETSLEKLFNTLDTTRFIDFSNDDFKLNMIDGDTSHPSKEGIKYISKLIIEKFNEL